MPVPIQSDIPVQLHRARFIDYTPSPITAISFAPLPLPPPRKTNINLNGDDAEQASSKGKAKAEPGDSSVETEFGSLFVARDNGSVEIWEWNREEGGVGNWTMEKVLPPTLTNPTISLMALSIRDPEDLYNKPYKVPRPSDLRLFTAGSESSELVERCLQTGRIKQTWSISSPPIWSLSVSPTHSLLCLSTTAQQLSFLSIADDTISLPPPYLLRTEHLPSRTKTVSLSWGPPALVPEDDEMVWRDTYLVTGNSDSSFRKWELPMGNTGRVNVISRAVVEKVQKWGRGGHKPNKGANQKGTIVWGVGVLPDHTIVTSDSLGSVTFWDGGSMAQKQTLQAHKADGMCLTIGQDGRTVFTSGPDQRVCQFTYSSNQWVLTANRRIHSHDVRALSIFPPYTPHRSALNPDQAPILASGGWDMSLALTPASSPDLLVDKLKNPLGRAKGMSRTLFEESFARKASFLGGGKGSGMVNVSRGGRLVLVRKERSIGVWRVLEEEQGWEKIVEMDLRLRTNLISSAISHDGNWMAVSDLYETKLFSLVDGSPQRHAAFLQTLLDSPELSHLDLASSGTGSSSLLFTPDSNRLILGLAHSGQVAVVDLYDDEAKVVKCLKRTDSVLGEPVPMRRKRKARWTTAMKMDRKRRLKGELPNGDIDMDEPAEEQGVSAPQQNGAPTPKKERSRRQHRKNLPNGDVNGHHDALQTPQKSSTGQVNGHIGDNGDEEEDSSDDNDGEDEEKSASDEGAWISTLAASNDGQWLAVADLLHRVYIFNLDTLQQTAILPTFPTTPITLAFPPAHPSLLAIVSPTGALTFYHIEHRKLLPPTAQLNTLNTAMRDQYDSAQGLTFEPSRENPRSSKMIIWSHDWLCTIKLDLELIGRQAGKKGNALLPNANTASALLSNGLDPMSPDSLGSPGGSSTASLSKSLRKKRAREAREALELVSLSNASGSGSSAEIPGTPTSISGSGGGKRKLHGISSKDDPEFYKFTLDRFRSVAHVDWFGPGELIVVERPLGDFMGELPQPFWTGSFGRS